MLYPPADTYVYRITLTKDVRIRITVEKGGEKKAREYVEDGFGAVIEERYRRIDLIAINGEPYQEDINEDESKEKETKDS